jgi:HSP20 family protein
MPNRRYPSIFDIFESFSRGFPFDRRERAEDSWFREPFDEMTRKFDQFMSSEFNSAISDDTSEGASRRYGPFVYGFSYTAEPGKEPVFREFGNVRPSARGLEKSEGREPMVDVMEEPEMYKIFAELPGVEKDNIKLDVAEESVQISTKDEKKFYKMIALEAAVNPDSARASYKNGVLTVEVDKAEKRTGKEVKVD